MTEPIPAIDVSAPSVQAAAFIERWRGVTASELSTSQSFVIQLCELLGVETPHPTPEQSYMFERPITFQHGDGSTSAGRVDCYRRGHFVWESKKLKSGIQSQASGAATTRAFDDALLRARAQAENYARALPAAEGRPPFVVVVDVGHVIELYAEFTRSGATYTPFPDPRSHRIRLEQLADPAIRARLKALWTDPLSLDPSRVSARVTRIVAAELADLARSLEAAGHAPQAVAAFLTRCLFSMFAEDVGLLPQVNPPGVDGIGSFVHLLKTYREQPATLAQMLKVFWAGMDAGGFNAAIAADVLRFNGKLFKGAGSDGYALALTTSQIDGLLRAARANWQEVEPAIFGTLLERALDPTERHALGAHYTPRAYVERLVLPTVVEPLRADWANAQAAAMVLAREADELDGKKREAKLEEARAEIRRFHHQLCTTRVLDPACGSGNFLYVTLEHLKRLEGEVMNQLEALGQTQDRLGLEGETVTLQQLRGIELNARAAALAELVLWIGWLQWHVRTRGLASVAEPVVHDYGNIENRDAVLAYDRAELATDDSGKVITRWDGVTFKQHPVTGEDVPDEAAQVPQWAYVNPRPAEWPAADFIVGNPPFIGKGKALRDSLGDGYVDALSAAWPDVPDSADFVMYWWSFAAEKTRLGAVRQFGLITTNSIKQTFNRRVIDKQLSMSESLKLLFAIPDHPWVDSGDGAAVRIAMTVCGRSDAAGRLLTVVNEQEVTGDAIDVHLEEAQGSIASDLRVKASLSKVRGLVSNGNVASTGFILGGRGFLLTADQCKTVVRAGGQRLIHPLRNGMDLLGNPRGVFVIDAYGLDEDTLRSEAPGIWQHLRSTVYPERQQNRDEKLRKSWWVFRRTGEQLRAAIEGLPRFVVTVETAKHRVFSFMNSDTYPEHVIIAVGTSDALQLGVLSSSVHVTWALAAGGTLEDRPRYNKSRCFETFPFPHDDTGLNPELTDRIRHLAEQLDTHRKRVLGQLPSRAAGPTPTVPLAVGQSGVVGADLARAARMRNPQPPADTAPAGTEPAETTDDQKSWIPAYAGMTEGPTEGTGATQAAAKGLTLTGLYNVLEKLRLGEPLNAKEKTQHEQGLVSVLGSLHDDLDAAVLQAYGWSDLGPVPWGDEAARAVWTETLLERLVALNLKRAAEEAAGTIRWLRPDFQDPARRAARAAAITGAARADPAAPSTGSPTATSGETGAPDDAQSLLDQEQTMTHPRWEQADLAIKMPESELAAPSAPPTPAPAAQAWPATLPEQVRAVAQLLAASPAPLPLPAIEAGFKGKGPWKKGLPQISTPWKPSAAHGAKGTGGGGETAPERLP